MGKNKKCLMCSKETINEYWSLCMEHAKERISKKYMLDCHHCPDNPTRNKDGCLNCEYIDVCTVWME